MRWTLLVRQANAPGRTVKPCGPVTSTLVSSLVDDDSMRRRGLPSPIPRGERGVSRKAIAQGVPDVFGQPVVTTRVWFFPFHPRLRVRLSARHSLRPLFERDIELQDSDAKSRRGIVESWLRSCRGHPSRRGLSAAPQDEAQSRGTKLNPHGEEPRSGVSNHEAPNHSLMTG